MLLRIFFPEFYMQRLTKMVAIFWLRRNWLNGFNMYKHDIYDWIVIVIGQIIKWQKMDQFLGKLIKKGHMEILVVSCEGWAVLWSYQRFSGIVLRIQLTCNIIYWKHCIISEVQCSCSLHTLIRAYSDVDRCLVQLTISFLETTCLMESFVLDDAPLQA